MRKWIRWLFLVWAGFAALTAIWDACSSPENPRGARAGPEPFQPRLLRLLVGERIKGFTSHWEHVFAEEMFALIIARGVPAVRARAAKLDSGSRPRACF